MQNKANLTEAQMNINLDMKSNYKILSRWLRPKKQTQFKPNLSQYKANLTQFKAKTNPIKANLAKGQKE